jgi:acyl-coenzyme A thioesterase PaaI-like protein
VGTLLHRTSTLAFCEASVFDDGGHLCAHATGTFKYLRALPTSKGGVKLQRRAAAAKE